MSLRFLLLTALGLGVLAFANLNMSAAEEKNAAAKVEEGKPAPQITLEATQIDKVLPGNKDAKMLNIPKDTKGKNVVLFFYPKAMTRGCTIESCGFRDKAADFAKLDTVVIGISTDNLEDQQKFTDKEKLTYPLLADPEKKATKTYGVLGNSGFANRWTFVIDKDGVVRKIYSKVNVSNHPTEVLEFVEKNLKK